MEINNYNYWIRTSLGLENIALEELSEKIAIKKSLVKHRSLFIETNVLPGKENKLFGELRTADDVYKIIGAFEGITNTKLSLNPFFDYIKKEIIPELKKYSNHKFVRVTVSFLGKRNFSRFFVENVINTLISESTNLNVLSSEKDEPHKEGELRIRCHIDNVEVVLGIALFDKPLHRRDWRVNTYEAQLHPPIAAAMWRIASDLKPSRVIDPFCGSGTILIESALIGSGVSFTGLDISETALNIAQKNAKNAEVNIKFLNRNAFADISVYKNCVIISNPPWGDKYKIEEGKKEDFVIKLKNLISNSDGAVMILSEDLVDAMKSIGLILEEIFKTRVAGKLAVVVKVK